MSTARSRFDSALARMDALIASVRSDCERETRILSIADVAPIEAARAPHVYGCTLAHDHEGDCLVPRAKSGTYRVTR